MLAQAGRATCWQCGALLSEPLWSVDRARGVDATMQLQAALLAAMRGRAPAWPGTGPLTAGGVVGVVEDLVTLLIASDTGNPAFMRVAAVHWPADLDFIRAHHRPSRVAAFPVAWRYIVMALAASVLIDPPRSMATIPVGAPALHQHPLHTLVASLTGPEWRHWEDRMTSWPSLVRATLQEARRLLAR